MTAPAYSVVSGRMVRDVEESPLPSLEEMAALLFSRCDGEARLAKRRVLLHYATVWAQFEGVAPAKAHQMAEALMDEATMTSAERDAEANR